ncbi:hypothetical protein KCV07_g6781, partial [Aureobasidium melanogenum]
MDGNQPTPDLKEQYRYAVLNLPIDNPTAYLREIKRLQGRMLDMEFEHLDHNQEPEKVRKDFKDVKKNTRELRLSPACLRAVQDSERAADEEPVPEQSTVDQLAVKAMTSGEHAVDGPAVNDSASPEHQTEEPAAKDPAITETTTTKKNKKRKKKKPASKDASMPEPAANPSEMESDTKANALTTRITQIHLEALQPKSSTDPNSEGYKNELIKNISDELLNVKCMVMSFMDTSDSFSARAMDEMTKLGERLANLKDGTKELMAVINELDKVRSRGIKCKREVRDVKEELIEVQLDFEDTKTELAEVKQELFETKKELAEVKAEFHVTKQELSDVNSELNSTKEELAEVKQELSETKNELAEVREKNKGTEKKMDEMYAWYKKQKEVPLGHFH